LKNNINFDKIITRVIINNGGGFLWVR